MANGGGAKDDVLEAVEDPASGAAEADGAAGAIGANLPRSATLSSPTDQLNRAIVRLLQDDGRLPFKTIAKKLGVSEGTVRNRVGWMTRAGMLRIVAVADPTAMNYRADAMLGVKVAPASSPAKVAERLAVHPEVVYILWVSGRFDLLVEIVCESDANFLDFLTQHCFDHDDIASLEVMTGLAMYKNQFLLKQDFA
jgi:Lrp/AsnC family transcriptional regulator for asnA, asnC and gidA